MATFYPDRPGPDTPRSELDVWKALEQLPNSWRVFHSVAWQVPKANRVLDGETDLVLLHKRHGLIVLEVKGGAISVEDGNWFQTSRNGDRHRLPQSPFEQCRRAMYDVRTYLESTVPSSAGMPCTRAVVLPGVSHPGAIGLEAPAEQIISRDELADIPAAIDRLIAYGNLDADLDPAVISSITALLAPTMKLRLLLRTAIEESERAIVELTDQQVRLLDFVRRRRLSLISGGAGTGKTILAMEQARRLADEGNRVLLTCFDRPLADHLRESLEREDMVIAGFHKFALDFIQRAGFVANFDDDQAAWWDEELPGLLPEAADRLDERFDAIVIDEGQDFRPPWFTALQLLLEDPDDGHFHVFFDEHQAIYVEDWERPLDEEPFHLDTNCRNTKPIADRVASVLDLDPASLGAPGPDPVWINAENLETIEVSLDEVIGGLLEKEKLQPDQIVVLTDRSDPAKELRGKNLGGTKTRKLGTSGTVVETIHRFKGLESDAVIVVLTRVPEDDAAKALIYIGMSRAKAVLIVIGPVETKKQLGW